jgi:hypothetical protein
MDEDEATVVVRRILAAPTSEAFDCASGAIVRLFSSLNKLNRRVVVLERRLDRIEHGARGNGHEPALAKAGGAGEVALPR